MNDSTRERAASEALIRKLHRELNGLTRSTRLTATATDRHADRPLGGLKTKNEPRGARRKSSTPCSLDGGSGSEASSSGSEGKEGRQQLHRPAKKPRKEVSPDPRTSRQPSPAVATSGGGQAKRPHKRSPDKHGRGGHSNEPHVPQPVVYGSALEAAAAAASKAVKQKVVNAARANGETSAGQRLVKCFHAGVRWGIVLASDSLKTRADLATALNDAFAGEIISCGRGEILCIVFLDGEGKVTEFPSLRSGARDSGWKAAVERAMKIYVRRG